MKHLKRLPLARAAMTLLLAVLTTMTAWAVHLTEKESIPVGNYGRWFVNMSKYADNADILDLSNSTIKAFKVYSDNGRGNTYSNNCHSYLTIYAPIGYVIELSGDILISASQGENDYMSVIDGVKTSQVKLINRESGNKHLPTVVSSGRIMTIYFHSDNKDNENYDGVDLDVKFVSLSVSGVSSNYNYTGSPIEINPVVKAGNDYLNENDGYTTLTLGTGFTATLDNGNGANSVNAFPFTITNPGAYTLNITAKEPYAGCAQKSVNFSVCPDGLSCSNGSFYVNMPQTGSNTVTLASADIPTFKVYDDGGANGNYSQGCNGYLTITAPSGYVLQLTGNITARAGSDLYVYDGVDDTADELLRSFSSTDAGVPASIPCLISTGQNMTLRFTTLSSSPYAGLDLTVTLINTSTSYNVTINSTTGGSVASNKSTAKVNETVTLTATPSDGYMVSNINVTDANSNVKAVTGGWYTNNQATFTMPASEATVTPTFTDKLTAAGGLYINMPKTGTLSATIPANVQSFKIYDDGGATGNYSYHCNGTLVLTAPEGYEFELAGSINTYSNGRLTIYNGDNNDQILLNGANGKSSITDINSTGNVMTLHFSSTDAFTCDGLDLTVTMTLASSHYVQDGDTYTIKSAKGWGQFCDELENNATGYFTGKTVKLGNDISVTRMAGDDSEHRFTGTFDGQGYTLTFICSNNYGYAAPFQYVKDCVIENLHVAGTITTSGDYGTYAAGIIGRIYGGTVTIRNCRSSVTINSSHSGTGYHGGFIGDGSGSAVTIEGCVFDGKLLTTGNATTGCGGFVGFRYSGCTLNISNSLYAPAALDEGETWVSSSNSATFAYNGASITNSFYTADFNDGMNHTAQGTQAYTLTTAPANLGAAVTGVSYTMLTAYENGILFDGKYYVAPEAVTFADNAANGVNSVNGYVADVTLDGRTLTKDGNWNTLCLPFSLSTEQIAASPLAGATIKELATTSNLDNGVLTLNFTTVTAIEADKPYIVKWTTTGANINNPVFTGVTITSTTPTPVTSDDGKVTFVGQFSPFDINSSNIDEIILMTSGNKLGYSQNPRTLKCFRAHFYVPANGGAAARSFVVDFGEGETTRIELPTFSPEGESTEASPRGGLVGVSCYDLQGRKLDGKPTAKGLYIVNGKKVLLP